MKIMKEKFEIRTTASVYEQDPLHRFSWNFLCWVADVSRIGTYEIMLVRLSVRLSLSFLKIGSSVAFSNILHDDSWP